MSNELTDEFLVVQRAEPVRRCVTFRAIEACRPFVLNGNLHVRLPYDAPTGNAVCLSPRIAVVTIGDHVRVQRARSVCEWTVAEDEQ